MDLSKLIEWLLYWFPIKRITSIDIRVGPVSEVSSPVSLGKIKGAQHMSLVLTDNQQVTLTIAPVDVKNNPAPVDGVPTWSSSDATIVAVTPAADGMSAVAVAVGPIGTAQVNVSADADLGAGVTTISGTLDVQVQAGNAVSLGISAGTPTDQVPPTPAPTS